MDLRPMSLGHESGEPHSGAPCQNHGRLARGFVHHSQVAPEHAAAEARPQRLGTGFLGGIALGIGRGTLSPSVRLAALDLSENSIRKPLAIALERLLDPPYINHVIAKANDHLRPRLPGFTAGRAASAGGRLLAG